MRYLRLAFVWGFVLWSGVVSAQESAEPSTVYVGFSLLELAIPQEAGAYVRARIDFWWDPLKDPDFSPEAVQFFNAVNPKALDRQRVTGGKEPFPSPGPDYAHGALIVTGHFKTYSDYADFPFDEHEIGILMYVPERGKETVRFVSRPEYLRTQFAFSGLSDGLQVHSLDFYPESKGFRDSVPATADGREEAFCAVSFVFDRDLSPYFVRILLPLVIIWALSYMSHFWRDSSPASRFSASAMIAAVALTFGVRGFVPPFNYLMAINVAFLGLFVCIAFDAITTALVFFLRGRGQPEVAEKIRYGAIAISPLLAVCALMSGWFISSHEMRDDLFQEPPSVTVNISE